MMKLDSNEPRHAASEDARAVRRAATGRYGWQKHRLEPRPVGVAGNVTNNVGRPQTRTMTSCKLGNENFVNCKYDFVTAKTERHPINTK